MDIFSSTSKRMCVRTCKFIFNRRFSRLSNFKTVNINPRSLKKESLKGRRLKRSRPTVSRRAFTPGELSPVSTVFQQSLFVFVPWLFPGRYKTLCFTFGCFVCGMGHHTKCVLESGNLTADPRRAFPLSLAASREILMSSFNETESADFRLLYIHMCVCVCVNVPPLDSSPSSPNPYVSITNFRR